MKKIFLGGKYGSVIGNYALVDDEDFEELSKLKWHCHKTHLDGLFYAERTDITKIGKGKWHREKVAMHRLILKIKVSKIRIDHKDHDGLNNQRKNLRIATPSQNSANKRKRRKYIGVMREVRKNGKICWRALCQKDGITYRITANSETDAAVKYNQLALKHHGEFANLNIIENEEN